MKLKSKITNGSSFTVHTKTWLVLLTAATFLLSGNGLWGQSCSVNHTIEAIQGNGANGKVGWVCGDGCDKHYYLAQNVSSFERDTSECHGPTTECGKDTYDIQEATCTIFNNGGSYISVNFDPSSCAMSSTIITISGYNVIGTWWYADGDSWHDVDPVTGQHWCHGWSAYEYYELPNGCVGVDPPDDAWTIVTNSTSTSTDPCGVTTTVTEEIARGEWWYSLVLKCYYSSSPGYQNEYTTSLAISRARACAMNRLESQSLPGSAPALCSFSLAADNSSASMTMASWRLRISGTVANQKYKITLNWLEMENGKITPLPEPRGDVTAPDQLVWYYPSEGGEMLVPTQPQTCGYSYSKQLVGATITPE